MLASAAKIEEQLDAGGGAATLGAAEICKPKGSSGGLPGGVCDSST